MTGESEQIQIGKLIQAQKALEARDLARRRQQQNIGSVRVWERQPGVNGDVRITYPNGGSGTASLLFNASYTYGGVYPAVRRQDGKVLIINKSHQPSPTELSRKKRKKEYPVRWLLVTERPAEGKLILRIGGNTDQPTEILSLPFAPNDTYSSRYPATVAQGVRCYFAFKLDLTGGEEDGWIISYGLTTGSLLTIATATTPWRNIRSVTLHKVTPAGSEIILHESHETVQNERFWQYYPVGYGNWLRSAATVSHSGSGDGFVRTETHVDTMYFDGSQSASTWTYSLHKSDPAQQYFKWGGQQLVRPQVTRQNSYAAYKGESYSYEPPLISQDGGVAIGPHIRYQPYIPGVRDGDVRQGGGDAPPSDPICGYVPEEDYVPGSTFYYWLWGRNNFGGPDAFLYNPNFYGEIPPYSTPPTVDDLWYWMPHFAFTQPSPANVRTVAITQANTPFLYYSLEYTTADAKTSLFNLVELRPLFTATFPPPQYFMFYNHYFFYHGAYGRTADLYCVVRRPDGSRKGPYRVPDTPYGDMGEERRSYLTSSTGDQFSTARAIPDNHYFYRKNHSIYADGIYTINDAELDVLFGQAAGAISLFTVDLLQLNGTWIKGYQEAEVFTFPIPEGENHAISYDRGKVQIYYYSL